METDATPTGRRAEAIALVAILALGVGLRVAWTGHLLVWDEAANLLSVRSYTSGSLDPYTHWFHRHPPLYAWVLALLSPSEPGFETRAELASIAFGVASIALLHLLNRRLFGVRVGLASAFFQAVMPAAVFYDLWVKRDVAVTTFALAALALVAMRRQLLAGLALGLAGLSKVTIALWVGPLAAAALSAWRAGRDARRSLAAGVVVALMVAGWWYVDAGDAFEAHAPFARGAQSSWLAPWSHHLVRVPAQVGWVPFALSLAGVGWAIRERRRFLEDPLRTWPVLLLVGGHALLMIPEAKTPWMVATLFPGWATLAALGVELAAGVARGPALRIGGALAIAAASVAPTLSTHHDRILADDLTAHFDGAWRARELGRALNERVGEGELVAIASQAIWEGLEDGLYVDPVLAWTLRPMAVLVRHSQDPPERLLGDVRELGVRWILYASDEASMEELAERAAAIPGVEVSAVEGVELVDLTGAPESAVPRKSYPPGLYR